uniref:Uncharacterized protein n=1 Tax=Picea sitchensis TaxID=3332 RepID=A9NVY5_PICSI|nr:unknown [Picea sitchensis]
MAYFVKWKTKTLHYQMNVRNISESIKLWKRGCQN